MRKASILGKCLWLIILQVLGTTAMFFYDKSPLVINPADSDKNTYLGYSLSYQKDLNNLVVGAPNDVTGKVFTCPLRLDLTSNHFEKTCTRYTVEGYINNFEDTKRYAEQYKIKLGASVAALPNSSFATCAQLWPRKYSVPGKSYVWGTCMEVCNNGEVKGFNHIQGPQKNQQGLIGNFAMKMLTDDVNGIVLVTAPASPPFFVDISYIKQKNSLNSKKSLHKGSDFKNTLAQYRNLGKALVTGNFFKKEKNEKSIYAVGLTDKNADGMVIFLTLTKGILTIKKSERDILQIKEDPKLTMLGASLCSASLNHDEYTDLIVGAPAQPGNQMDTEYGAIHIYLGSYYADDFVQRKLTIMGRNDRSRFGFVISAHDLDKDGLPEIFVSALYENEGILYILSGFEMKRKLDESQPRPRINVVDFKSRQEIKNDNFKLLGFSMMPVPDLDGNGCDELAVGAPGSDKIMILRCIPTINITITAELLEYEIVPEIVNDFNISVCINLKYESKMEKITANINITNEVDGTGISSINDMDKTFVLDLSNKSADYCRNVSVHIVDNRVGSYKFKTQATLTNNEFDKTTFDRSWVRDGSYSVLSKLLKIQRACSGKECEYNLTMDITWSAGELNTKAVPAGKYTVGLKNETMTVHINNWGRPVYDGCVVITVEHAPISKLDYTDITEGQYICRLPEGLMPNQKSDIAIQLKTGSLTDEYRSFQVTAVLYNECKKKDKNQTLNIIIDYEFNADEVSVTGTSNTPSITEKSMKTDAETIDVIHTYTIENKGSVLKKNVSMVVVVTQDIMDSVKELKVYIGKCSPKEVNSVNCTLDLEPMSTTKVGVTVVLRKKEIENTLMANNLKVATELSLYPRFITEDKQARVDGIPVFEKDSSLGQNKTLIILIAVIVAIIIIGIVIFVLYKNGFFIRKKKQELQEEIRRRSVKRSVGELLPPESTVEISEEDMDDDAFHCDDPSTNAAGTSSVRNSTRASKRSFSKETDKPEGVAEENEKD